MMMFSFLILKTREKMKDEVSEVENLEEVQELFEVQVKKLQWFCAIVTPRYSHISP
jgi:hypothetical protein